MNRSISRGDVRHLLAGICLSVLLGATLWARPSVVAAAEEQPLRRVLLLADKPGDLFIERIKTELLGLGWSVVIRAPSGPLEEDARSQHAVAAIRMLPTRNGVEVWMADAISGRSLLRQVVVDERPEGPDQNLIAQQTAELLRISLFPKTPKSPGTHAENAPANPLPQTAATATPAASRVAALTRTPETGAQAGVGALLSPGGAGPEFQLWLSLHHFFGHHFGLAADVSLPVVGSALDGPEGKAKIGCTLAGLAVLARVHSAPSAWFLSAGLGAAALRLSVDGEARPTLTSNSTSLFTGAGYARIEGGYAPTYWLRLGAHGMGGAAFNRVHFHFAGNDAGSWGRTFTAAALFAEIAW